MKKLLAHIGMPKTASSSLQKALGDGRALLQDKGVCYPTVPVQMFRPENGGFDGFANQHSFLAFAYEPRELWQDWFTVKVRDLPEAEIALQHHACDILAEMGASSGAILSSEHFYSMSDGAVQAMARAFRDDNWEDLHALALIRRPDEFYLSHVQEMLKHRTYIQSPEEVYYHPDRILDQWAREWAVCAVPFEKQGAAGRDWATESFAAIARVFGHEVGELRAALANENESISAEGMLILQSYRQAHMAGRDHEGWDDIRRILNALRRSKVNLPQTSPRLRADISDAILARRRTSTDRLRERYGVSFTACEPAGDDTALPERVTDVRSILDSYDARVLAELPLELVRIIALDGTDASLRLADRVERVELGEAFT